MGIFRLIGLFLLFTVSFSQLDRSAIIKRLVEQNYGLYYIQGSSETRNVEVGEILDFMLDATETKPNGVSLSSNLSPNLRVTELEKVQGELTGLYKYQIVPTAPGDHTFFAPVWKNGNKEKEIPIYLKGVSQKDMMFVGDGYNTTEVQTSVRRVLRVYGSYTTGDVGWRVKNAPESLPFSGFSPNKEYFPVYGHRKPMQKATGRASRRGTYNLELEYVRSPQSTPESRSIRIVVT